MRINYVILCICSACNNIFFSPQLETSHVLNRTTPKSICFSTLYSLIKRRQLHRSYLLCNRVLLRIELIHVPHQILNTSLATNKKWPLNHFHISYQNFEISYQAETWHEIVWWFQWFSLVFPEFTGSEPKIVLFCCSEQF